MFEHAAGQSQGTTARSRGLKRRMTPTEQRLWQELRKLGLNFRRQADFACHGRRLVIEVDGVVHERLADVAARDAERQRWLEGEGYRVLRFTDRQVRNDVHGCMEQVKEALLFDGGGLGGGASTEFGCVALVGADAFLSASVATAGTPPSPTLPPSRRKGV